MKITKKCPLKIANHNKRPLLFFNNSPTLIYAKTSDGGYSPMSKIKIAKIALKLSIPTAHPRLRRNWRLLHL